MSRANSRFRILEPFPAPASRSYARSILTNREWANLEENLHVQRVDIDPVETQPRTQAIMPGWRYGTGDRMNYLETWLCMPAPQEEVAVEAAATKLEGELEELEAKTELSDEDRRRIDELYRDVEVLRYQRYWQQSWNSFGDGRAALYRACSAANVPYKIRSSWQLETDRPFTWFVHRCKPEEAQKDCRVRLRFGRWALIVSQERDVELVRYKDGRLWEADPDAGDDNPLGNGRWVDYRGTDFDATDRQEEAIEALRDNGRLTAADRQQIATWQQQLRSTKAELKKNRRLWEASGETDRIEQAEAYCADLKRQIETLRESKRGLAPEVETQIKRLEQALYAEKKTVAWAHMAESTFNVDLAVTIIPQPRGYLVLHNSIGRDYCVCDDASVTETGLDGTMIAPTCVQVDGNGGALWFSMSYIIPERYSRLRSRRCSFDGVPVAGQGALHWDATVPPGTEIVGRVIANSKATDYRWEIEIACDPALGRLPFLYRLYFDLPATVRPTSAVVFDSASAPDLAWDVGFSREEENRGRTATLKLTLAAHQRERYEWLSRLQRYQLELWEGEQLFAGELGEFDVDWVGAHRRIEARAYDRWAIMVEDRMWCDLIGDGRKLGDYVRLIGQGAGLAPTEMIIARNDITERRLPRALPGEEPALQPEWGGSRGDWLARLCDDFAYYHDLWFDGRGRLHLEPICAVSTEVHLRTAHAGAGDRDAVWNVRETISKDSLRNYLIVFGRSINGRQLSSLWIDNESARVRTSPRYVGRIIAEQPYHNDALNTQALCDLTCAWRGYQMSRVDHRIACTGHYRTDLAVGDRLRLDGYVVELVSVGADDRVGEQVTYDLRVLR